MANGDEKFESEALPLILATIQRARESAIQERQKAEIIIHISENGGMDGLQLERKKKIK